MQIAHDQGDNQRQHSMAQGKELQILFLDRILSLSEYHLWNNLQCYY